MGSYIFKQHQQKSSSRRDTSLIAIFAAKWLKRQEIPAGAGRVFINEQINC